MPTGSLAGRWRSAQGGSARECWKGDGRSSWEECWAVLGLSSSSAHLHSIEGEEAGTRGGQADAEAEEESDDVGRRSRTTCTGSGDGRLQSVTDNGGARNSRSLGSSQAQPGLVRFGRCRVRGRTAAAVRIRRVRVRMGPGETASGADDHSRRHRHSVTRG